MLFLKIIIAQYLFKRLYLSAFLILLISEFVFAQDNGWFWLNPWPQGNSLNNVWVFTQSGYVISSAKVIVDL